MGWFSDAFDSAVDLGRRVRDFREGKRQGEIDAAKDIGQEWVDTGKFSWDILSSSETREQAWQGIKSSASKTWDYGKAVYADPEKVVRDATSAVGEAYSQAEEFLTTADARELGHAYGYGKTRAVYEVATTAVPVGKLGKVGKVGTVAKVGDKIEDAADAVQMARRTDLLDDIAEQAAKRHDAAPGHCAGCEKAKLAEGGDKPTINDHRKHHNAYRDAVIEELESRGYKVADGEAMFGQAGAKGRTRPDILYQAPDGSIGIIEVKTGKAGLSTRQGELFPLIESGDAVPVGGVAEDFGLDVGVPLKDQGFPNGIPIRTQPFKGIEE